MKDIALFWTEYEPLEKDFSLQDPLAYDYFAQQLGNRVLPSFTTRTSRARYYSMVCYGIFICQEIFRIKNHSFNVKDFRKYYSLYEKIWAFAVAYYYTESGFEKNYVEYDFRGKNGAFAAVDKYKSKTLKINFKLLERQLELGSLGAYKSSLIDLGILKNNDYELSPKGYDLARTFLDEKKDNIFIDFILSETITKGKKLFDLGEECRLDKKINGHERKLLKELIIENGKNYTTISLISKYSKNELEKFFGEIVKKRPDNNEEANIIAAYKTIILFEKCFNELSIIWKELIKKIIDEEDSYSLRQTEFYIKNTCLSEIKEFEKNVVQLQKQVDYKVIKNSYHGSEFSKFVASYKDSFIKALCDYHIQITRNRNTGSWIKISGDNIKLLSGVEYLQNTDGTNLLHNYKTSNIRNIIADIGWENKK